MFVASKFEDLYPLKLQTVYEKIAHQKISTEKIKEIELEMMLSVEYIIHTPTVLDFLKIYLVDTLNIEIGSSTDTKAKHEAAISSTFQKSLRIKQKSRRSELDSLRLMNRKNNDGSTHDNFLSFLIEKLAIYLAKLVVHDIDLAQENPSLLAVGSIYVALKVAEQLTKKELISTDVILRLKNTSQRNEDEILDISQRVLHLTQNFDSEFPGMTNLKSTHFSVITELLNSQ